MYRNAIFAILIMAILLGSFMTAYLMWQSPRAYYIAITVGVTRPQTSPFEFFRDLFGYIFARPRVPEVNATKPVLAAKTPMSYEEVEDVWQFIDYVNAHESEINAKLQELAARYGVELPKGDYAVFVQVVRPGGEAVYLTFHYSDGKFTRVEEGWHAYPNETVVAKITHVKEEFLIRCFKLLMEGKYEQLNDEAVHGYFAKSYVIEEINLSW